MRGHRAYSTFVASLLTVGMRWTDRAIAIASTVILARLLVPEDFGIVAMGSLVIGFADVLLNFSVHIALIRDPNVTQDHYDSAWTIGLLQGVVSAVVLIAVAPFAATYFEDPRVELVVQALALSAILAGLQNIGMVQFQKNMQFGAEFRFLFLKRITGFVAVVTAAAMLRSYWALVIGNVAANAAGALLSYAMHPMRPRLSLAKFHDIFGISQWMLISNIGAYLRFNLHRILVGRWSSTSTMGAYTLADEISSLPSAELLAPISRALFPAFAKVKDDLSELKQKLLLAQSVQSLLAMPVAVGLAVVAQDAVAVLLGDKWQIAVPFLQILSLVNVLAALTASGYYALIVVGDVRASAMFVWVEVGLFAALALTVFSGGEAAVIAWLKLGVTGVSLALIVALILRGIPTLRLSDLAAASWRPVCGAIVMAGAVSALASQVEVEPLTSLCLKVAVGATAYTLCIGVLWWLAGLRPGAESYLIEKASWHLRLKRGTS